MLPDAPVLTPQQVALVFAVSAETIIRWAEAGELKGFQTPKGRWRFHRDDVEQRIAVGAPREAAS